MTRRTLQQILKRNNIEEYIPAEERFDAGKHKKVGEEPGKKGMVVRVLKNGWMANGVVFQLPEVIVGL